MRGSRWAVFFELLCGKESEVRMNEYRGKHASSVPWAVSSTASSHYRSRHLQRNHRRKRIIVFLLILALILAAAPFLDPVLILQTDRVSLTSEDLPGDVGRLRVVYLTDVHYGFFFPDSRVGSLLATINNLKPDLVIFGGDIGDSPEDAIDFFRRVSSLHVRYAMLGVLGETDHGEDDVKRSMVTDAMRDAGVIPLVNEVASVRIGGTSTVYVAGLDDVRMGKPALSALAARTSAEDFVIFVSHNPSVIPESQRVTDRNGRLGWFDLALFGHTHGGQIRGLSGLLDIAGDVEDRYQSGWLTENRSSLLISNGVGTSVIPARVFCPAQIHCIEISVP